MSLFEDEARELVGLYPKLNIVNRLGKITLDGVIELLDEQGDLLDSYQLEIQESDGYPFMFPLVFEIGKKFPVNIEWHVYEGLGNCCIKIPPEEELICKDGLSLKVFIEEQLLPYLFNQTFRRENGYYINERPHGVAGLIDYYGEQLGSKDKREIVKLLGNILFKPELNRVALCFCGSGEKYRRCHRDAYRLLSKIKRDNLLMHLQVLIDDIKKDPKQ